MLQRPTTRLHDVLRRLVETLPSIESCSHGLPLVLASFGRTYPRRQIGECGQEQSCKRFRYFSGPFLLLAMISTQLQSSNCDSMNRRDGRDGLFAYKNSDCMQWTIVCENG